MTTPLRKGHLVRYVGTNPRVADGYRLNPVDVGIVISFSKFVGARVIFFADPHADDPWEISSRDLERVYTNPKENKNDVHQ